MASEQQIPQYEWENYVQYRDRMSELEGMSKDDVEADKEYGKLLSLCSEIEEKYDYIELNERYKHQDLEGGYRKVMLNLSK